MIYLIILFKLFFFSIDPGRNSSPAAIIAILILYLLFKLSPKSNNEKLYINFWDFLTFKTGQYSKF